MLEEIPSPQPSPRKAEARGQEGLTHWRMYLQVASEWRVCGLSDRKRSPFFGDFRPPVKRHFAVFRKESHSDDFSSKVFYYVHSL